MGVTSPQTASVPDRHSPSAEVRFPPVPQPKEAPRRFTIKVQAPIPT